MPAKYKDYPLYSYDEPATYEDFKGGINTDPSNEHLIKSELRNCINMTYLSGALVKRKGAKKIADITCDDALINIQGIFLFTYKITYIIIAADGKLYQGIYNEGITIELTRLYIYKPETVKDVMYDEEDTFVGLQEIPEDSLPDKFDGCLQSYFRNLINDTLISKGDTYEYDDIQNNQYVTTGTVIERTSTIKTSYLCLKDFTKEAGYTIPTLVANGYIEELNTSTSNYKKETVMLFQNYKKVEGATFNNKLYIATGTRIIEIYVLSNGLHARPVAPYLCNMTEVTKIGYNYLSPYPELAVASQKDTVTTSISALKVSKLLNGRYRLTPIMNIQIGDSVDNYVYRWEKRINNVWYVIKTFASQMPSYLYSEDQHENIEPIPQYYLDVTDADKYSYRCTFAKAFESPDVTVNEWDINSDYSAGDYVSVGAKVYKCRVSYNASDYHFDQLSFQTTAFKMEENSVTNTEVTLWDEVFDIEMLPYLQTYNDGTQHKTYMYDYVIDKVTGEYFGSATSVLFNNDISINDTFLTIHSCTKVLADGNKLLFYSDQYNSGLWFKTIINNPGYITDRGCLSFKTTKNEEVIRVIPFQGNLIIFANAKDVGGSIHLVTGNGDDYNDDSGYYSPYQRKTINASISCDNADTIQICDNIIVFKYFNRIYYINASDLSNDVVKVTSCNDRLISSNKEIEIPWDDNNCISEVTDTYYALLWKEKYEMDSNGDLILVYPGLRVKMYYKIANQVQENVYALPWLIDESEYFNVDHIIYVRGKPIYLYHNLLISFNEDVYDDLGEDYTCTIHFRAEDLNYPKLYKLLSNVLIYFHRNQYELIDLDLIARNEAGHKLIDKNNITKSKQDFKVLKANYTEIDEKTRLDSTILDSKVINTSYKFPCLLVDTTLIVKTKGVFSISSITYNYTTIESPDTSPYDLYQSILRPKEVK